MVVEIALAIISSLAGLSGIIRYFMKSKESRIILQSKDGDRINFPANISKKDFEMLLQKTKELEKKGKIEIESKEDVSKNSGFATIEFLLLVVPGIIALLFAGTFVYLIVTNQDTPNYTTPKELGAAMTTIIGYYFGIGASTAVNKGKNLSLEDIKKLIGNG